MDSSDELHACDKLLLNAVAQRRFAKHVEPQQTQPPQQSQHSQSPSSSPEAHPLPDLAQADTPTSDIHLTACDRLLINRVRMNKRGMTTTQ